MELHSKRLSAVAFVLVALMVLLAAQNNTSFLLLFPMLLLLLVVSWYLYKEIQKDNEESFKRGIRYLEEEQEAQLWLHKSFVPKVRKLAKKELQIIVAASFIALMSFIFLWSFFVGGFFVAVWNTLIGLFFFLTFLIYALYAPKEFDHLFKRVPKRYRHHSKNDWVHAYLLLFPFAIIGFFLYSLTTTGEGIIGSLFAAVFFIFPYTFLFIGVYCVWFLYQEYQRETQESLKKKAKKMLKE